MHDIQRALPDGGVRLGVGRDVDRAGSDPEVPPPHRPLPPDEPPTPLLPDPGEPPPIIPDPLPDRPEPERSGGIR